MKTFETLYGLFAGDDRRDGLFNGETAVIREGKTLAISCGNCGDYHEISIETLREAIETLDKL